jgi:hypothetical protein
LTGFPVSPLLLVSEDESKKSSDLNSRVAIAIQVNSQAISIDRRLNRSKGDQMSKQKLITTRRILFALTLAVIISIPTAMLRAQSSDEPATAQTAAQGGLLDPLERMIGQHHAQRLEGSWVVTVTPVVPPGVPQPSSFRAYATIARGGAFIGTDTRRLFNIQHGAWKHLGGNEFAWTFIEELVDALGNFAGTVKVRVKLAITGANEFVGVSNAEQRNADGVVTDIRCGTIRGVRIKVEPLAEQCQSISPPQ